MYLQKLEINRFRSCESTRVNFQKELTVLVGENNGGKSNILDAIRLSTAPLNGRRDRYAEDSDIRHNADPANFEIRSEYSDLSDTLKGMMITAVPDPAQNVAKFGCRYEPSTSESRGRFTSWAGKFDTADPESGSQELIRHVYLPALRDAQQALGTGGTARIMSLFRHFLPPEEQEQFLEDMRRTADMPAALTRMNTDIGSALQALTGGVRPQSAEVGFASEGVQDVARDLRFKLGDAGANMEEIRASGLGYANLLYMSTVIVELTKAKDADLTLFLVEEPEAHLHPQLQMLVLEFLLEKAKESFDREVPAGQPEGRIQIVVSTHSPNLTAWASPKHLVVVRSKTGEDELPATACVPIADIGLTEPVLGKINRYLDVTRSALLFSNKAALIEGIAEALIIPQIARKITLRDNPAALQRFKGTILVPIEGVDFKPYVEVLLRPNDGVSIADNVVVVTDGDPALPGNRQADLEALAETFDAGDKVHVFTNDVTLEHDLYAAGNHNLLKQAFLLLHPRSEEAWNTAIDAKPAGERADAFTAFIKDKDVRKGDFAQAIAGLIESGEEFVVPEYLTNAITAIAS